MNLSRPARTRLGLGGLLGGRFLLLTRTGRNSGRPARSSWRSWAATGRRAASWSPRATEPAPSGTATSWPTPGVRFQVGRRRYQGLARPLPPAESGRRLAGYAHRHPHAGASLLRAIGQDVDGSDAAYERIGSDPEHGIPLVALLPR
jgi:hypothetical protein